MIEIIEYGQFFDNKESTKKTRIVLTHTSRNLESYLIGLKYRHNGRYIKIPNYIITRDGIVLKLLSNNQYSNFFNDNYFDEQTIIVCLENLGWLQKEPLNNQYVNWIGDIYKGRVFERKWRDYFFWHPYTEEQVNVTSQLCKGLLKEFSISNQCSEHNTKINGIRKFEGVVTRSNFSDKYTDLNPSFDFENFRKLLFNE